MQQQYTSNIPYKRPYSREHRSPSPSRSPKPTKSHLKGSKGCTPRCTVNKPRMKARPANWTSTAHIPGSIDRFDPEKQKELEAGWHDLHPNRIAEASWVAGPQEEAFQFGKDASQTWKLKNKNPSDIRFPAENPIGSLHASGLWASESRLHGTREQEGMVGGLTESGNLAYEIYAVRRASKQGGGMGTPPQSLRRGDAEGAPEIRELAPSESYPTLGGDSRRLSRHLAQNDPAMQDGQHENMPDQHKKKQQRPHSSEQPKQLSDRFVSQVVYRRPLTSGGNPRRAQHPHSAPSSPRRRQRSQDQNHVGFSETGDLGQQFSVADRYISSVMSRLPPNSSLPSSPNQRQQSTRKSADRPKTAPTMNPYPRRRTLQSPIEKFGDPNTSSFGFDVKNTVDNDEEIWMDIKLRGVSGNVGQVCFHPNHYLKDLRRTIQIQLRHRIDFKFFFLYSDGIKINLQQEVKLKASQFWPAIMLQPRIDESTIRGTNRPTVAQLRKSQQNMVVSSSEPLLKRASRSPPPRRQRREKWNVEHPLYEYEEYRQNLGHQRQEEMLMFLGGEDAIQEKSSEAYLYDRTKKTLEIYADQAAITLQSFARRKNAQRVVQQRREMHHSAIKIQSWSQGYLCRKKLAHESEAAILIQSLVRKEIARRVVQEKVECRNAGATRLQSWYRGNQVRRELGRQISAATQIQSGYRMWAVKENARRQDRAAVVVQSQARAYLNSRKYQHQRHGATVIQSKVRQHLAKKETSALRYHRCAEAMVSTLVTSVFLLFNQKCLGATKIQSMARQQFAKREVAGLRFRRTTELLGAFVVQEGFARAVEVVAARREALQAAKMKAEQDAAAIKIQCLVRNNKAKKRYRTQKEYMEREVFFSQKTAVSMGGRSLLVYLRGNTKEVICHYTDARTLTTMNIVIPLVEISEERAGRSGDSLTREDKIEYCMFAIAKERAKAHEVEQLRNEAATKIQCQVRKKASSKLVDQRREERDAAIKIQSIARGGNARNLVIQKKCERSYPLGVALVGQMRYFVKVDTYFKGCIKVNLYDPVDQSESIVIIPEEEFGHMALKIFRKLKRKAKIQAVVKLLDSWVIEQEYEREIRNDAAIAIQSTARGHQGRKKAMVRRHQRREEAATTIQSTVRRRRAHKVTEARRKQRQQAAVRIQTSARARQGRQRAAHLREERQRQRAAVKIQSLNRQYQAKKKVHGIRYHRNKAATVIQTKERGRQAKNQVIMMKRQHKAATQIQSAARGRLSRKRVEEIRQEEEELRTLEEESAVAIQCLFRKAQASKVIEEKRNQHQAATKVQSAIRVNLAKKEKEERLKSRILPLDFEIIGRKYVGKYLETAWYIKYSFHLENNPKSGGTFSLTLEDFRNLGYYGESFKELEEEIKQKLCFVHLTKWRMDELEREKAQENA